MWSYYYYKDMELWDWMNSSLISTSSQICDKTTIYGWEDKIYTTEETLTWILNWFMYINLQLHIIFQLLNKSSLLKHLLGTTHIITILFHGHLDD